MVKKLKFLLINQTEWKLLFKAFLLTLTLFLVELFGFSWWAILVFFLFLIGIYFTQLSERHLIRVSFWLLPLLILFSLHSLSILPSCSLSLVPCPLSLIAYLLYFSLTFIVLGLGNFFFTHRHTIYSLLNTILILLTSLLLFSSKFQVTSFKFNFLYLAFFLIIIFIFKEVLHFFEVSWAKRSLIVSLAVSLVGLELAWLITFLPLGFINAAAFLTLFFILIRESIVSHFRGTLNLPFIMRQLTFFVLLTLIIFAVSRWTI